MPMPRKPFDDNELRLRDRPPRGWLLWFALCLLVGLGALTVAAGTVVALGVALSASAQAQPVPRTALAYRSELTRSARSVWGLDAPVATFAAQVHQESGWRPEAVSHVGAAGLAQFMPATSRWIAGLDPSLRTNQPFSPSWALRALVTYDHYLYVRTPSHYAPRDRMWVALRGYNGGLGHWQAEARNAANNSREAVDAACGSARRHRSHCAENLGYPQRILIVLQPRYAAWGPAL